jgi:hypothetical protein
LHNATRPEPAREETVLVLTSQVHTRGEGGITRLEPLGYLVTRILVGQLLTETIAVPGNRGASRDTALCPTEHSSDHFRYFADHELVQLFRREVVPQLLQVIRHLSHQPPVFTRRSETEVLKDCLFYDCVRDGVLSFQTQRTRVSEVAHGANPPVLSVIMTKRQPLVAYIIYHIRQINASSRYLTMDT